MIASMIVFTVLEARLVLHEILIGVFVTVTTPVTLMLLGRAAIYRDPDQLPRVEAPKEDLPEADGAQLEKD